MPEVKTIPGYDERAPFTLQHLASHTSGLEREPSAAGVSAGPVDEWEALTLTAIPTASFMPGENGQPGTVWRYCNIGYAILGLAVARVARAHGRPGGLEQLLQEELFGRYALESTGYLVPPESRSRLAHGYTQETVDPSLLEVPIGRRDWYPNSTLKDDNKALLERLQLSVPALATADGDAADDNDLHSLATLNVLLEGIGEPPETTLPPHLRGVELTPQLLLDAAEAHADPMGRRHGADPICSAFMAACPDELEWASSTADAEEAGRGFRLANGGIYSTAHDLARFVGVLSAHPPPSTGTGALSGWSLRSQMTAMRSAVGWPEGPEGNDSTTATHERTVHYGLGLFSTVPKGRGRQEPGEKEGRHIAYHAGGTPGFSAEIAFDVLTGWGAVVLRNYQGGRVNIARVAIEAAAAAAEQEDPSYSDAKL